MKNKLAIFLVLFTFLNYVIGCTSGRTVRIDRTDTDFSGEIRSLRLKDGKIINFHSDTGPFVLRRALLGKIHDDLPIALDIDSLSCLHSSVPETISASVLSRQHVFSLVRHNHKLVVFDGAGGSYDTVSQMITGKTKDGHSFRASIKLVKKIRTSEVQCVNQDDLSAGHTSIAEAVDTREVFYEFTTDGASYHESVLVVRGMLETGEIVCIPLSEIVELNVQSLSVARSATLLLVTPLVFLVIIFVAYGLSEKNSL